MLFCQGFRLTNFIVFEQNTSFTKSQGTAPKRESLSGVFGENIKPTRASKQVQILVAQHKIKFVTHSRLWKNETKHHNRIMSNKGQNQIPGPDSVLDKRHLWKLLVHAKCKMKMWNILVNSLEGKNNVWQEFCLKSQPAVGSFSSETVFIAQRASLRGHGSLCVAAFLVLPSACTRNFLFQQDIECEAQFQPKQVRKNKGKLLFFGGNAKCDPLERISFS